MIERRTLLCAAAAAALAGRLSPAEAQHVHQNHAAAAAQAGGAYQPRVFTAHEYRTLRLLAGMIVPPENGQAGGVEAGAPEFIDTLASGSERLADIFTGGIAWMDSWMRADSGTAFADAPPVRRSALLDLIAYRRNAAPALNPGIAFFDWARRLVVDAWSTSPAGYEALGYQGNRGMTVFQVPEEALRYALQRSPFRER
ncbi:MAG: gluconate 2-dehydrogenase subunit 3 family protein [Bryobacteraceae bacterium]|nr:gluconate 2-dehydrogenase subunit 3 family protein [Bryobacteraceae bacterium]